MTIKPDDPNRDAKWHEFRSRYIGSRGIVHPLNRKQRSDGHMRRAVTIRWHRYVWAALHTAVAGTWSSRHSPSTNLSALTEWIITDWLVANHGFNPRWIIEGESSTIPDSVWDTWQAHEAHRAGKKTGQWPRPQKDTQSHPTALIASSTTPHTSPNEGHSSLS